MHNLFFCHGISGQNTDSPCAPNNGVIRVRTMYSAVVARSGLWFTLRLGSAHVHNCFISTTPLFVGTMAAKHLTLDEQMLIDTVVKKEKGSGMDAFRAVAKARTKQSGIPHTKERFTATSMAIRTDGASKRPGEGNVC